MHRTATNLFAPEGVASMTRLYFSRRHTSGTLAGIAIHDSLTFTSPARAASWIKGTRDAHRAKKRGWELADATFQRRRCDA